MIQTLFNPYLNQINVKVKEKNQNKMISYQINLSYLKN